MSTYPEHEKQHKIVEQSQAIGEFLDFAPYTLCEHREAGDNGEPEYIWTQRALGTMPERRDWNPRLHDYIDGRALHNPDYESWDEDYVPVMKSISQILADYFGIDQKKIEKEKRAMLDAIREAQS